MKRKITFMIGAIVVLAALIGAYFFLSNRPEENEPEEETVTENVTLFDKDSGDLTKLTIEKEDETIVLKRENEDADWTSPDYPNIIIDGGKPNNMAQNISTYSSSQIIENDGNLSDLGLDPPQITVTGEFSDNSTNKLFIGKATPAKDNYYAMVENDKNIYLVSKYAAENYLLSLIDFIDKTVDMPESALITDLEFQQENKDKVHLTISESFTEEEIEQSQAGGSAPLAMIEPIASDSLNSYYFSEKFLPLLAGFKIQEVIDYEISDEKDYGFDNPTYWLNVSGDEKSLGFKIGDNIEDSDNAYCTIEGRQELFAVSQKIATDFNSVDATKFVLRFVDIPNIDTVDSFTITANGKEHIALLNRTIEESEVEGEEDKIIIEPTIDGKSVGDEEFRTFYRIVIGLSYDAVVDKEGLDLEGEPAVVVEYQLVDGEQGNISEYFDYNENFYIVRQNGEISDVVSKLSVDAMVDSIEALKNGELAKE